MKTPSETLHKLVQSLNQSGKRYFELLYYILFFLAIMPNYLVFEQAIRKFLPSTYIVNN